MRVGEIFQRVALTPIRAAQQSLRQNQTAEMLNSVSADRLSDALARARSAVAQAASVGEYAVNAVLVDDGREVLNRLAVAHQTAVEVWNQHESTAAGLLEKFVGGFVDGYLGVDGVGDFLAQLGGGFARDARLKGPMQEVAQHLGEYEQYVSRCCALLNANSELERGQRAVNWRRTRAWMIGGLVVFAIAAAAMIHDATTSSSGLPAASASASTESQRYDQSCSAVADGLGKRSLTPADVAFLGDGADQLLRAQSKELTAEDLAIAAAQMPCGRSSSSARLRASWIDGACQSVKVWAVARDVAEDVIASLTDGRCDMPAEGKANFHSMAENAAKSELSAPRTTTDAGRAAATCKLDGQLGAAPGIYCRTLLARTGKKLSGAGPRPATAATSSTVGIDPSPKRPGRQDCLRACVAECHDDSSCERSCVAQRCPAQ